MRRIVLSGFGTEDTHHNLHTLRWGPDGRLYMNQSIYIHTHIETPQGVVRLKSGGILRFDPRDEQLEVLFRGWVNTWGHQFDQYGQSFLTDGAGGEGITWGVPGAMYFTLRRRAPQAARQRQPRATIRSSAAWRSSTARTSPPTGRATRSPAISARTASCASRSSDDGRRLRHQADARPDAHHRRHLPPDRREARARTARSTSPTGRNPIINHGEVDFRDPRRDHEHGRIWRITAKGRPLESAA